jgi:glucose-6-phosphate-specific signal transduction histidine kinase
MIRFERLIFNFLIGMVFPAICFLGCWGISFLLTRNERTIIIVSLSGLCLGLVIDFLVYYFFKPDIFKLSKPVLIIIYLFYNTWLFGFFMGVPVFHLALGIIAGYYWMKRLIYQNKIRDYKREIHRTSLFTSFIIGVVCLFSATFALISPSTPSDLKGMLRLPFEISQTILLCIIIAGGLILIVAQYYLTRATMFSVLKLFKTDQP